MGIFCEFALEQLQTTASELFLINLLCYTKSFPQFSPKYFGYFVPFSLSLSLSLPLSLSLFLFLYFQAIQLIAIFSLLGIEEIFKF